MRSNLEFDLDNKPCIIVEASKIIFLTFVSNGKIVRTLFDEDYVSEEWYIR